MLFAKKTGLSKFWSYWFTRDFLAFFYDLYLNIQSFRAPKKVIYIGYYDRKCMSMSIRACGAV